MKKNITYISIILILLVLVCALCAAIVYLYNRQKNPLLTIQNVSQESVPETIQLKTEAIPIENQKVIQQTEEPVVKDEAQERLYSELEKRGIRPREAMYYE